MATHPGRQHSLRGRDKVPYWPHVTVTVTRQVAERTSDGSPALRDQPSSRLTVTPVAGVLSGAHLTQSSTLTPVNGPSQTTLLSSLSGLEDPGPTRLAAASSADSPGIGSSTSTVSSEETSFHERKAGMSSNQLGVLVAACVCLGGGLLIALIVIARMHKQNGSKIKGDEEDYAWDGHNASDASAPPTPIELQVHDTDSNSFHSSTNSGTSLSRNTQSTVSRTFSQKSWLR